MLTTVKGYYDHGQIILQEEPPVMEKTDVIVTFLSDEKNEERKEKKKIRLGLLEGKIKISDDFNDPLEDLKDYM